MLLLLFIFGKNFSLSMCVFVYVCVWVCLILFCMIVFISNFICFRMTTTTTGLHSFLSYIFVGCLVYVLYPNKFPFCFVFSHPVLLSLQDSSSHFFVLAIPYPPPTKTKTFEFLIFVLCVNEILDLSLFASSSSSSLTFSSNFLTIVVVY